MRVTNETGSPKDLTWFDYTDLDVNRLGQDTVRSELHAGTLVITQENVQSQWTNISQDGHFLFTQPTAFDLDTFGGKLVSAGGQPTILDNLLDGTPTTSTALLQSIVNPNDIIYAVQFDFNNVQNNVTMRDNMTALVPDFRNLRLMRC